MIEARSLWAAARSGVARPALDANTTVDVAIIGAGYTGLWTALSLLRAEPTCRVLVVDAEHVGFGASGRNGGWCIGELAGGLPGWVATAGRDAGVRMTRAIIDTVEVIEETLRQEGIDCGFVRGGSTRLARSQPQLDRQRHELADYRSFGFGDDVLAALTAEEATERVSATGVLGALQYGPCARIHPVHLADGLATAVERRGGTIVEDTEVIEIVPGSPVIVRTHGGNIRADVAVRATEAYTPHLPGLHRSYIPLYSLMIATEPLDAATWESIGLAGRETFSDDRRMVIYGQRTVDDRIAFGGRGAPYRWGSAIATDVEQDQTTHDRLRETLVDLFPTLADTTITHRWGGVLAVPRDWRPSVGLDRTTGLAWAGGYVGEGVAASNLAGRTLADLITGAGSDLTDLAWVGHRSPTWEPEPLRWFGVTASRWAMDRADRVEQRTGRASRAAALVERFIR